MKTIRKTDKTRGFTIIEVVLASLIGLIVLAIAYSSFSGVKGSYNVMESRVSARQELIKATNYIHNDVRNAAYVFAGREVRMDGIDFKLYGIDVESREMIVAIPEKLSQEPETYTVVAYYLTDTTDDPVNRDTKNLIRYEKTGVVPSIANTPASIDLEQVTGGAKKTVARYINPARFTFTIRENGASVDINPIASRREISGQKPVDVEVFTSVNLRNR